MPLKVGLLFGVTFERFPGDRSRSAVCWRPLLTRGANSPGCSASSFVLPSCAFIRLVGTFSCAERLALLVAPRCRIHIGRRASLRSSDSSHLPALLASAEKPIPAIGLEARNKQSWRHFEPLENLSRSRIDSPRSLSSPSEVACQSSPSTQVTPVTKRLDSMVQRSPL